MPEPKPPDKAGWDRFAFLPTSPCAQCRVGPKYRATFGRYEKVRLQPNQRTPSRSDSVRLLDPASSAQAAFRPRCQKTSTRAGVQVRDPGDEIIPPGVLRFADRRRRCTRQHEFPWLQECVRPL